jgi:hypothetical protein
MASIWKYSALKVFRPLYFFLILLRYSLILKCLNCLFFSLINVNTTSHNDKAKRVYFNSYKCVINKKLKYHIYISIQTLYSVFVEAQACHTCIRGVSPILLFRSSQALSGWMGSVAAQLL